ncbi:MAG: DNA/RNA non-specific endonuclease [Bacteroidetes bacterium]|nr:DNA/RNA non-specific endonuclease [Bacteroidota bacterium]
MKIKISFLFLISCLYVSAQYNLSAVLPKVKAMQLQYSGFTVAFDTTICSPVYSVYILTKEKLNHSPGDRKNFKFLNDSRVHCTLVDDYKYSGYDKGHLTPFADSKYSAESMHDCFYVSNMCPQIHSFNAGIWERLERNVRKIAQKYDSIIVISAPVIKSEHNVGKLVVPAKFYKILYSVKYNQGIAFIMDQSSEGNIFDYSYPISSIDTLTKLKFFPVNKMRNTFQKTFWNINEK